MINSRETMNVYRKCSLDYTQWPGSDPLVLEFIREFLYKDGPDGADVLYSVFANGYCYHFANILKSVFHRGKICIAYPYSHIVWVDRKHWFKPAVAYDINGVFWFHDRLIPISRVSNNALLPYLHIPGTGDDET